MSETKDVVVPIKNAIKKAGWKVFRMNSGKVKVRGGWVQLCDEGTADLLGFKWNRPPLWVEAKKRGNTTRKSRQEAQGRFGEDMMALGHTYVVATSLDDVLGVL